jgi:pimeloyl-ACP methyl ester carboxylesterase
VRPTTSYAKSGDVSIAYQVVGNGPLDLIVVPGWISHLDLHWEMFGFEAWVQRLARFSRVILFDKRGCDLSDRDVGDSTLEERMDDLRAVLDAVRSERTAVLGFSEGGSLAMVFAATYPERVTHLALFGTFPRAAEAPDFPEGAAASARIGEMLRIVTASSPPSTGRRALSTARRASAARCGRSDSRCGPACIPASASARARR